MGFTNLKNKIASKFNSSSTSNQHSTPKITIHGSVQPTAPEQSQSYYTVSAPIQAAAPSNSYNPSAPTNATEKEQKLMDRLHMSEEEKQKEVEERRKYVKEYLRTNRDVHAYHMGANSFPKLF